MNSKFTGSVDGLEVERELIILRVRGLGKAMVESTATTQSQGGSLRGSLLSTFAALTMPSGVMVKLVLTVPGASSCSKGDLHSSPDLRLVGHDDPLDGLGRKGNLLTSGPPSIPADSASGGVLHEPSWCWY